MMDFIAIPAIVGIITFGIYSIFELFARRKERMAIVEKLGDIDPKMMEGKLKLNAFGRNSFGAMKAGALLIGLGLGLLIGFFLDIYYQDLVNWETRSIVYGAPILLCGGLALLGAFLIEYKLARKDEK